VETWHARFGKFNEGKVIGVRCHGGQRRIWNVSRRGQAPMELLTVSCPLFGAFE
jgi:hypothetical protein